MFGLSRRLYCETAKTGLEYSNIVRMHSAEKTYYLNVLLRIASRLEAISFSTVDLRVDRNKKLLGAPGLTTRSKDATRGSWHCY